MKILMGIITSLHYYIILLVQVVLLKPLLLQRSQTVAQMENLGDVLHEQCRWCICVVICNSVITRHSLVRA